MAPNSFKMRSRTVARKSTQLIMAAAASAIAGAVANPARAGLTFNNTWDSTVTSRSDAAQVESGFIYAESIFSGLFSDNITINLTLVAGTSGLASAAPMGSIKDYSYSEMKNALTSHLTSAAGIASVAQLVDFGVGSVYRITPAQEKALGLRAADDSRSDGKVTFGGQHSWTYDPNDRAHTGFLGSTDEALGAKYDFIGTMEHEIAHAIGRFPDLGLNNRYSVFDESRFSSAGVHDATNDGAAYYSIDKGVTALRYFNTSSDTSDWDTAVAGDAFNFELGAGVQNDMSASDLTVMNTLGFTPIAKANAAIVSGNWLNPNLWTGNRTTVAGDDARVVGGLLFGNTVVNVDGSTGILNTLTIDSVGNAVGTVNLNGSYAIQTTGNETIGNTGSGVLNQSAGANIVGNGGTLYLGAGNNSNGTYNLSGGSANIPFIVAGAGNGSFGTLNQTGGAVTTGGFALGYFPGSTGIYSLNHGVLTVSGAATIGATGGGIGIFSQTNGISTFNGGLTISAGGQLSQMGGFMFATNFTLNNGGIFSLGSGAASTLTYNTFNQTGGSFLAGDTEYVPSSATYIQSGGIHSGGLDLVLGHDTGTTSNYQLSGSGQMTFQGNYIGFNGNGLFTQTGGTNTVSYLFVAFNGGSSGTYSLSGGTLNAANLWMYNGGVFNYTGGTLRSTTGVVQSGGAFIASNAVSLNVDSLSGVASYELDGGTLSALAQENIGINGNGVFTQTGGVHTASSFLVLAAGSGAGVYNLQGGLLNVGLATDIGLGGDATFNQSGGIANLSSALNVGSFGNINCIGLINMTGGSLTSSSLSLGGSGTSAVGVGTLNLSGGSLTASSGTTIYNTDNGTNHSGINLSTGGVLTTSFIKTPDWSRLNFSGGTLNLTGGTSSNTGFLDIGQNGPGTATLNLSGGLLSTNLDERVGKGGGTGIVNQSNGSTNSVTFNLYVSYDGSSHGTYNMSGGSLNVGQQINVARGAVGAFNQTGGTVNSSWADVGSSANTLGTFNLSGGSFTTVNEVNVGRNGGIGIANFSGGTETSAYIEVGHGATGTLSVSNGATVHLARQLNVGDAESGVAGTGTLNVTGGTITVGTNFNIGNTSIDRGSVNQSGGQISVTGSTFIGNGTPSGTNGIYTLGGGVLTTAAITTRDWSRVHLYGGTLNLTTGTSSNSGQLLVGGNGGNATLNQTTAGGVVTLTNNIAVGIDGTGTYNLGTGASLSTTTDEYIGISGAHVGVGTFHQSGGTHAVGGRVFMGYNASDSGTFAISGGTLSIGSVSSLSLVVGNNGTGTFNQTGGTVTVSAEMDLGRSSGAQGVYNLNGPGSLTVNGPAILGKNFSSATGTFNQTDGASAFNGGLTIGNGGAGVVNLSGGTFTASSGIQIYGTDSGTNHSGINLSGGTTTIGGGLTMPDWSRLHFTGGALNLTGGVSSNAGTLVIGTPTSSATLNLSGGTLAATAVVDNGLFNQSGGTSRLGALTGTGNLIVGGSGTAMASADSLVLPNVTVTTNGTLNIGPATGLVQPVTISNALTITNNANVNFFPTVTADTASGVKTNVVQTLSIGSNGLLDIGNHMISVDNTATPFARVHQYIDNAYNRAASGFGDYTGRGGVTSSVVKAHTDFMSVGYYNGALQDPTNPDNVGQILGPNSNSGHGTGIPLTQILIRPTLTGDLNGDGVVNAYDVNLFNSFGLFGQNTPLGYQAGDLNGDGKVDAKDVTIFNSAGNFNSGSYAVTTASAKAATAASTLTGSGHSASPAAAVLNPSAGTLAFSYDPATGDVKVNYNGFTGFAGKAAFNTTNHALSLIDIASTGGAFALDSSKLSAAAQAALGSITISPDGNDIGMTAVNGYLPDGTDIGNILAPGLDPQALAGALTLTFNYTGSRVLSGGTAGLISTPEPTAISLLGLGVMGLLARRRRDNTPGMKSVSL